MVDDRNDDHDNDNSSISKPKRKCVDIYANDNTKTIVPMNIIIYGRFPTNFQFLIPLITNDKVDDSISF